jgi:hypothetical protein
MVRYLFKDAIWTEFVNLIMLILLGEECKLC